MHKRLIERKAQACKLAHQPHQEVEDEEEEEVKEEAKDENSEKGPDAVGLEVDELWRIRLRLLEEEYVERKRRKAELYKRWREWKKRKVEGGGERGG